MTFYDQRHVIRDVATEKLFYENCLEVRSSSIWVAVKDGPSVAGNSKSNQRKAIQTNLNFSNETNLLEQNRFNFGCFWKGFPYLVDEQLARKMVIRNLVAGTQKLLQLL